MTPKFDRMIQILSEDVANTPHGSFAWVQHRTSNPFPLMSGGFDIKKNKSAMYGKGLYATYKFNDLRGYGDYIVRGYADISNYAIFEKSIYDAMETPHKDGSKTWEEHLKLINTKNEPIEKYSSKISAANWQSLESKYDGLVFRGERDGNVIAIKGDGSSFKPHSYAYNPDRKPENLKWVFGASKILQRNLLNNGVYTGNLKIVDGKLSGRDDMIHFGEYNFDINNIVEVRGDLDIVGDIEISSIKKVYGNVEITNVKSLGSIRKIASNDLEKSIGMANRGTLRIVGDSESLGDLTEVGDIIIPHSSLKSLGDRYIKMESLVIRKNQMDIPDWFDAEVFVVYNSGSLADHIDYSNRRK